MPAPTSTWTTQDTNDWVAGELVRKTKLKQALLENPQYLYDAVTTLQDEFAKQVWFYGAANAG